MVIYEKLGRLERQANEFGNLGNCYRQQGDISKAIEQYQRAMAIYENLGRLDGEANSLGSLGACYGQQGDISKAIEHHQRALAINEKLGRLEGQASQFGNLGSCYMQGDIPKAIEHHQRALAIYEKLGALQSQAITLHNLGHCHRSQADLVRALDCYQRALALFRRIGLPDHAHYVRVTLDAMARLTAAPSRSPSVSFGARRNRPVLLDCRDLLGDYYPRKPEGVGSGRVVEGVDAMALMTAARALGAGELSRGA
jgi:tetratricopeptide (TPR) repeat protein